jgi:hypothetical protein
MLVVPVDGMRSILIMSCMVHGEFPGRVEVSLTWRTLESPQQPQRVAFIVIDRSFTYSRMAIARPWETGAEE